MKANDESQNSLFLQKSKKKEVNLPNKIQRMVMISMIVGIIFLIGISLISFFLYKNLSNENKNFPEELLEDNSISAIYSVKSGQKVQLFNTEKIGLKDDDYIIQIVEKNNNNLRKLRGIIDENGSFIPNESGYISVIIKFKIILTNLNEIFKDNQDLIKVDLSNLEMANVTSMNSTFSGCSNLNDIKLDGVNTDNLFYMTYTFEKCINLKNINLSPINPYNLRYIKGIFSECYELKILNISSFENVNEYMFEGIKSKPSIIANPYSVQKISYIFYTLFEININITIVNYQNENKKRDQCIIGENEKCKECNDFIPGNCLTCNKGYYLPFDKFINRECLPCNKIVDNCSSCFGIRNHIKCSSCDPAFYLEKNKCIEKEEECIIGEKEKCKSCKTEKGRKKECKTCNEGYIISRKNPTICSKCSIDNCKSCSISNGKEVCNQCLDTFLTIKDEYGFIKSCECQPGYDILEGKCIKPYGNWIKILMNVDNSWNNGLAHILDNSRAKIKSDEIEVYINGTNTQVNVGMDCISYKFNKSGIYALDVNIKKILTSMEWLFNSNFIFSVSFMPGFDSSQVTSMENMFINSNIESIDMKYLDISNVKNLKYFIHENYLVKRIEKLKEYIIDISSFDTSQVTICAGMFHDISDDVIIKISNKFTKCKEQIPFVNKVINIDEIECQKFENCEKCNGSKESLKCSKCIAGYKLNKDNICIKQKCHVGEKEKCFECNIEKEKENECSSCNEGYYLPSNYFSKNSCKKCGVEGCKFCNNIDGICEECKDYYIPLINKGKIIECNPICELGEGNKCKTCNLESKNKCGDCNPGYKLMNDGICKKIENSFIASYNVTSLKDPTYIMNLKGNNINFSNIEMYINDKKVEPYLVYDYPYIIYHKNAFVSYKFPKLGINEVKIIINQKLSKIQNLFYLCRDVVNITFSDTFDTSNVHCMQYMFGSCSSLISLDLSSFNTSLVSDYTYMFSGCNRLTSIDLSNFEGQYSCGFESMFMSLKNLTYIDISSLYSIYPQCNRLNLWNVPYNGIIIANKKFKGIYSNNWKIIYKD